MLCMLATRDFKFFKFPLPHVNGQATETLKQSFAFIVHVLLVMHTMS